MNTLIKQETGEIVHAGSIAGLTPKQILEQAKREEETYQLLCQQYLTLEDYETIQGKEFKKKSAWRKLGRAQKVSIEIIEEREQQYPDGTFAYHFRARAHSSLWGNYSDGSGSCASDEKGVDKTIHNTRATAETRAINRAISNLIGAGEVSAEEINEKVASNETIIDPYKFQGEDKYQPKTIALCLKWRATEKAIGWLRGQMEEKGITSEVAIKAMKIAAETNESKAIAESIPTDSKIFYSSLNYFQFRWLKESVLKSKSKEVSSTKGEEAAQNSQG